MTTFTPHARIIDRPAEGALPASTVVEVHWDWDEGTLDRPHTTGIAFAATPHGRRLAQRYARCVEAGDAFETPTLTRDVNNRTFVQARSRIWAKRANADLRRLGY